LRRTVQREHGPIQRVVSFNEATNYLAAELREELSVPGDTRTTAERYRDKWVMFQSFRRAGLPTPETRLLTVDSGARLAVLRAARLVAEATGDRRPFVSLRTIDESYFRPGAASVSSHLHVDTATVTLACTYVGAGTQWTPDGNVRRAEFRSRKMQRPDEPVDRLLVDPAVLTESPRFEISVLKGEIREHEDEHSREFLGNFLDPAEIAPYNVGGGLVHRGPGASGRTRLLLTVSSMRVPRSGVTR
jgi:hypothetical protein